MTRVVVTGMGAITPNGRNLDEFCQSLLHHVSGIKFHKHLEEIGMRCCVAGIPIEDDTILKTNFSTSDIKHITSKNIKYACIAATEAWIDAGLVINNDIEDLETGCIIGCSTGDIHQFREVIQKVDNHQIKRLGTRFIEQLMVSGASAKVAGLLGLGNRVFSNSSACATGTESIIMGYEYIRSGRAKRMLAGSCESPDEYIWSNFDNMRILARGYNDIPEKSSRPLSASAKGFIPGAGAGILVLETLETAIQRNAKIYAEIIGGFSNSGGQRRGGSMTAPNKNGVVNCIKGALKDAAILPENVDLISGHLTATMADPIEIENWSVALGRKQKKFPKINTLKSMIGHCLSAAGSIEIVSLILQVHHEFIHANMNCKDIHKDILKNIDAGCIPQERESYKIRTALKANFGFGDVNATIAIKKYNA
ncbi:beta-ketoacyl synthase [Aquimarina sp. RZ0]|uniref:beta-ketoacyl-[acyl-carrier-protein] synthase family protein n=1 Tax=Aquimarina sp. RZ0 TaxID=2607730 RepID=UPI0011F139C2|nr:beta-ketoacyl-[acyl-carrier-protein] synthase family protein [Aquimarina sp. RZ0]KAA1243618.1 beta-ketoacyl-[acyl-carrier-protein] synthase family protein [Aquimarina sp. RZ0]